MRRLVRAVALYRGDFRAELTLHDSVPFEEWAQITREALHGQALDALYTLAVHHERLGEYGPAHAYARRQIALEPWREEARRQLIRSLALDGQRSAALAQYAARRRLLIDELGVEPCPAAGP